MSKIFKSKSIIIFSMLISPIGFSLDSINSTNHLKEIVFGAGCFWSVEKKFQETFGVVNVESGYADGKNIKPIYREIIKRDNRFNPDNFAEVVRVTYNSNQVELENLIKLFFEIHDPTQENRQGNDIGVQYRSLILTSSEEEKIISNKIKVEFQDLLNEKGFGPIKTDIKVLQLSLIHI